MIPLFSVSCCVNIHCENPAAYYSPLHCHALFQKHPALKSLLCSEVAPIFYPSNYTISLGLPFLSPASYLVRIKSPLRPICCAPQIRQELVANC